MTQVQILRYARMFMFCGLLLLPAIAWILAGPVGPYEGRAQTEYPSFETAIAPPLEGRTQLSDALLERAWFRRTALSVRYGLDFHVFGEVETEQVVTGERGWLFFRPQFDNWNCDRVPLIERGLTRLRFLAEVVDAGDVPMVFAIAPNKATVERERVTGRAAHHLSCYDENEARVRAAAAADPTGRIIDHSAYLLSIREDEPQFYQWDSHWTGVTAAAAFNQLVNEAPFPLAGALDLSRTAINEIRPGMPNRMLLQSVTETGERVVASPLTDGEREAVLDRIVVHHDSFYDAFVGFFSARAEAADLFTVNRPTGAELPQALERADAVIVERVERNLAAQFSLLGRVGGNRELYGWMIQRLAISADNCAWGESIDLIDAQEGVEFRRLVRGDDGFSPGAGGNARIFVTPPSAWQGEPLCLRVTLSSPQHGFARLFVPDMADQGSYTGMRSLQWNYAGGDEPVEIATVVPSFNAARPLRLDPMGADRPYTITRLEIAPQRALTGGR